MRSIKKVLFLLAAFGAFQNADAQFFKKLKDKVKRAAEETVERKVEDKAIETTEKAVDSVFTVGSGKRKSKKKKSKEAVQVKKSSVESFGKATLIGPNHGAIEIIEIGQPQVKFNEEAHTTQISAWWVTHGADSYDMFDFTINQLVNEDIQLPLTINLPQEGNLTLYYDGLLGAYLSEDEWERKKDPEFKLVHNNPPISGTLTLSILNENEIQFSFEGSGFSGQVRVNNPKMEKSEGVTVNTSPTKKKTDTSPPFELKEDKPGLYDFDYEVATLVTSHDGETYPISYLINTSANYFGMKVDMEGYGDGSVEGNSTIVMDNGNTRIFVDTPMMKMQLSQDMAGGQAQQMPEMGTYDYTKPQKTGNTKTIMGYMCDEYIVEHQDEKIIFWAAPNLAIPNWMFGSQQAVEQTGVLGFVLEFTAIDNKGGTTKSKVTDIIDNLSLHINAKDYKKMF